MEETPKKKKRVSFSQYSMWLKCPYQYYNSYVLGKRVFESTIHTCFGTAMHHALQTYIEILYTTGLSEAESLDMNDLFLKKFDEELNKEGKEGKEGKKAVYTAEEYAEFLVDAKNVIYEFLKITNRGKYFPTQKYEFIGVEVPIEMDIINNISFIAFLDLVLRDTKTGKYKILDFKTSSAGWNSYMKEDEGKISQILLYKVFYSKKFNVDISMIDVEFFILKRKLYEGVSYPQSRLQIFKPVDSKPLLDSSVSNFVTFVKECFTDDGEYDVDRKFLKIPGKNKKNCKYCSFHKVTCDGKADLLDKDLE